MKGKFLRVLFIAAVTLIGFSVFGCGMMPENKNEYKTWVEHIKAVGDIKALDIVHVSFLSKIQKVDGISVDTVKESLNKCIADGSCGTVARLFVDGAYTDEILSCTCRLGDIKDAGTTYKIWAHCTVPVEGGLDKDKEYKLLLNTVSPETLYSSNLVFSSSPLFDVTDSKIIIQKIAQVSL